MNNTVDLLSRWRLPLYENKDAFEILSFVYRNLSADPQEISDALGTPRARVANTIRELYKAGLLYTKAGQLLFASEKASAFMESEDMLDLGLESLMREMLPNSDSDGMQQWLQEAGSQIDKRDSLYRLQLARCMDTTLGRAKESVWKRVFKLLHRRSQSILVISNFDELLESAHDRSGDSEDLYRLWKFSEMPASDETQEVLYRSVIFLSTYWISNPHHDYLAHHQVNAQRCADIFSSWHSKKLQYNLSSISTLLNRCSIDRTFAPSEMTRDRIVAEIRRPRQIQNDPLHLFGLSAGKRLWKLLSKNPTPETISEAEIQSSSSSTLSSSTTDSV